MLRYHHADVKGDRKIAAINSWLRQYMGVSGQRQAPAVLHPLGMDPLYSLVMRLGGPLSWSRHKG
jgi:hypothetical protein